jgi:hypothetical protein
MSSSSATDAGWYVYGVVAAGPALADAVRGGEPIEAEHEVVVIAEGAIAAIASHVSLDDFDEANFSERTGDLSWLIDKTRRHEDVLERALAATTVVPFRFGTIYRDEAALRRFLVEDEERLARLLARLEGRVELGVKAFVDRTRLDRALVNRSPNLATREEELASVSEGRGYLLRRQQERVLATEVAEFEAACATESHELIAAHAEDARVNPPQRSELSGRAEPMILNGAYLVRARDRLDGALDELRRRYGPYGVEYELTGPWPAYNFVDEESR